MRIFVPAAAAALTVAGLSLGGCIIVAGNEGPGDRELQAGWSDDGKLEKLYSATVRPDGLEVRVASNGCTHEDSFDVDVDRVGGDNRYSISLERENPDRCKALMADGVDLFFSRQRLGLADDAVIQVANPVER